MPEAVKARVSRLCEGNYAQSSKTANSLRNTQRKIKSDSRHYFDMLTMLTQIGAMKEHTRAAAA